MTKEKYAIFYDIKASKLTVFKYVDDIVDNIVSYRQEQIKVKSIYAEKEIEFYKYYYDIPAENLIVV